MVSMLASSAVDHGFKPGSSQTEDYKILFLLLQHYEERTKTGWLGIRIMCLSGVTCLPTDSYLRELALLKSRWACWSSTKRTSSSFLQIQLVLAMIQLENCSLSFGVNEQKMKSAHTQYHAHTYFGLISCVYNTDYATVTCSRPLNLPHWIFSSPCQRQFELLASVVR